MNESIERSIQTAVARADLIVCAALRTLAVAAALGVVLVLLVLLVRARLPDPYEIDYDAPGVDITNEGPEGYTEEWHEWGDGK